MVASDIPRKRSPRDGAGRMDLPSETGPIVRMIGHSGFLEVYAALGTYRIQTPDNLDPERTVPDVPWAQKKASNVGPANPIAARVFIQAHDALQQANYPKVEAQKILPHLHACKEEIIVCESAYLANKLEHDQIERLIREGAVTRKGSTIVCPQELYGSTKHRFRCDVYRSILLP